MITPRTTRLVRADGLQAFRDAVVALATAGTPEDARDRLVVVPTRAAALQLLRTLEDSLLPARGAVLLPDLITPGEIVTSLAARLAPAAPVLTDAEREVLFGVACRTARDAGHQAPFRVRPGLVAEALRFYDALRRQQKDVDTFERLALGALEPGASYDRGAERLVRQTRFLVAAFRDFERRSSDAGADEHALRARLVREAAGRPCRDVVLTVTDRSSDRFGLWPADWDLLTRLPGLEQLTIVVSDAVLAGALHERLHDVLPGIEEVRFDSATAGAPALVGGVVQVVRDREEEVALFARRVKQAVRRGGPALDRHALVVRQPLPYVYVAREVLRSAGIPCQTFDALPLAGEPYAAAVDLVLDAVRSQFSRPAAIALLRSPHFRFADDGAVSPVDIEALDRALGEAGYLGDRNALEVLLQRWRDSEGGPEGPPLRESSRGESSGESSRGESSGESSRGESSQSSRGESSRRRASLRARAIRGGALLSRIAGELEPVGEPGPMAERLGALAAFLLRYENPPGPDDPFHDRQARARTAIGAMLAGLGDAYRRFDAAPVEFEELAGLIRRWIEVRTFAPRSGDSGVHLVDAESARFGRFDAVHIAGLVEGEWPEQPQRNIFYSPAILRDLGWPQESARIDTARAAFTDLLRLPSARLVVSTFTLEADALVTPSPLLDEVERAGLRPLDEPLDGWRVFEFEALSRDPVVTAGLDAGVEAWAARRAGAPSQDDPRFHGSTAPPAPAGYSLSGLERYQDCPFKFFAAEVLRLQEPQEDESALSPRARGRFIHEVFQRFFEAWDPSTPLGASPSTPLGASPSTSLGASRRGRTIDPECIDDARRLFAEVAEPLLAALPGADAALERTRLFGSAISVGIVDVVLGLEASRPVAVTERWLEYRLEGEFALGSNDGRRVSLRGVADRVDLLEGRRLRVIDYKSGSAPNPRRALQVPIYALCAQERLIDRDLAPWAVDAAAYVAFSGKRSLAAVVKPGDAGAADTLEEARERLFTLVDGIERGEFPPRPHDEMLCRHCAYPSVCRKDYAGDD